MKRAYKIKYPRRRLVRAILRFLTRFLVHRLGKLELIGLENVPASGPVILAANHFNFVDPPLLLATSPRLVEFIGGAERPNSPFWSQMIPQMWGFIRAYRGGYGRSTFRESLGVLEQGGVLGVFPEGGSWAALLRPARPGVAYLAAQSGAVVVPISICGATDLLGNGKSPVSLQFHPPMAAPVITSRGTARRAALDAYGEEVMAVIASGLPDAQRGMFSSDADAREAALAVSDYPFHEESMRGQ